jgi:uncharacterized protein (DUF2267 family)
MHRDDLLTQVRIRARLHGRSHARRVVRAVMHALHRHVPEPAFRGLAAQLPADIGALSADRHHVSRSRPTGTSACRRLIRDVADELHIDELNAVFFIRVTLAQLNVFCRGVAPAQLAASLPVDLRPLLTALPDDPAHRYRHLVQEWSSAVTTLSLQDPAPAPARRAVRPGVASGRTNSVGRQRRRHAT